jgi:hypothetical protein
MSYDFWVKPRSDGEVRQRAEVEELCASMSLEERGDGFVRSDTGQSIYYEVDLEGPSAAEVNKIRVGVPLPSLECSGREAFKHALALADRLQWNAVDVQLDRAISDGDLPAVLGKQREWRNAAAEAKGIAATAGLLEVDGWFVEDRALYELVVDKPTPRRFGYTDQLKEELRSPIAVVTWLTAVILLVAGIVGQRWYLLLGTGAIAWLFGPPFFQLTTLMRKGRVVVFHSRTVVPSPVQRGRALAIIAESDDALARNSGFSLPREAALAVFAQSQELELLVLGHEAAPGLSRILGFRAPKR